MVKGTGNTNKPLVSICIPVYYSGPEAPRVLGELIDSINTQDYSNVRVCLSVQKCNAAEFDSIMEVARRSKHTREVLRPTAEVDGPAKNTNSALSMAKSEGYIKLMNQDDFFDSPTALSDMVGVLEDKDGRWLMSMCVHTDSAGEQRERVHVPTWPGEKGMVEGANTLGCPSIAMFRADTLPTCDPNVLLCMDCDMWIQMVRKVGVPLIYRKPDIVIRMWDEQLSRQINYVESLENDKAYMRQKYGYK